MLIVQARHLKLGHYNSTEYHIQHVFDNVIWQTLASARGDASAHVTASTQAFHADNVHMNAPAKTMKRVRRPSDAQRASAEVTRTALINAACAQFGKVGYHATGTNDLVALASVTRGALYHHFADKADLFETVLREVAQKLVSTANAKVASLSGDTWGQLMESFPAYLRLVTTSPEAQRILLIDGPAVLGWKRWRDIQSEYVLSGVVVALRMLMDEGIIARRAPEPLANLIQAALDDAALSIAHAADPQAVGAEAADALVCLLAGLRIDGHNLSTE